MVLLALISWLVVGGQFLGHADLAFVLAYSIRGHNKGIGRIDRSNAGPYPSRVDVEGSILLGCDQRRLPWRCNRVFHEIFNKFLNLRELV